MWLKPKFAANSFFLLFFCCVFAGCSLDRRVATKVKKAFQESAFLHQYPVGFELFDLDKGKVIYGQNNHQYFVPASNTKLYTFYAALMTLPDTIPALRYIEKGDSLIFWGTGDPSFLHRELQGKRALEFLRKHRGKLFYAPGRYTGEIYGAGWAWDDYNEDFQAEITELPLYGNLVEVQVEGGMKISPGAFQPAFLRDSLSDRPQGSIKRDFLNNRFHVPSGTLTFKTQLLPFKTSTALTLALLTDTLHREVGGIALKMPDSARTLFDLPRDSVLKQMLLPSDNFIAEQLLLLCADQVSASLGTAETIAATEKKFLASLPDKPVWVDGSGLSRYNLFTPADMVRVLELIYKRVNDRKKLFAMLPAGGKSGTLKRAYPTTDQPFVFAKTGTLSGVHNQSGYVVTRRGKTYIFSFMNNNFVQPVAQVRKEMVKMMMYIHENF
ncbi:peptidase S13 [Pedobacter sp. HMWF019]|nr:peptidase S13 [Pedobacter sp. HMWF019]